MSVISNLLTFIRFSHTLFALPFALGAMVVASHGWPACPLFLQILACMVLARTAAMSFNRIVDWEIDQRNPRTVLRHQLVSKSIAIFLCGSSALFFVGVTALINHLCFVLSPVALGVIFFYSLTKRFTPFAQFFLGLALAVAPVGAWIAVRGCIDFPVLVLAAGVLCWVAGFDIIYATQDVEVDQKEHLYSMVVWLGIPSALRLARWLHLLLFVALIGFGMMTQQHSVYYYVLLPVPFLLFYEHRIATTANIDQINRAFFHVNILVGFLFFLATIIS
ncbi:MAG: putative 4-hydroxybenzoate polyprenyltransferase [Chthoniobacterales bacterium]|nr:putative 4-hydroxybenzoate polyprenyltransferase [Chthoniobacterales bacterium]